MLARIYRPTKTAMQSGRRNTRQWVLEYEPDGRKQLDPLMGWTGSGDMRGQIRLTFATEKDAVGYAERHAIPYRVMKDHKRKRTLRSYAENFR